MKTEAEIRQKLDELNTEWVKSNNKLLLNKQIKLLEWVLDEDTTIEVY
jgi:hypothetical protein